MNAFELLSRRARELPQEPALREKVRGLYHTVSWSELEQEVVALATGLRQRGFRPSDVAVVAGETRPRLLATVLAVHALGGVVVPLRPRSAAPAVSELFETVRPRIAFVDDGAELERLAPFVGRELGALLVDSDRGLRHRLDDGVLDYGAVRDAGACKAERFVPATNPPSSTAFLVPFRAAEKLDMLAISHDDLAEAGERLGRDGRLLLSDDVVLTASLSNAESAIVAWAAWLSVGFRLSTAERSDSAAVDIRELGPTALFASAAELSEMAERTLARLGAAGSARRHVAAWALRRPERRLARHLVLSPLADRLGLSRLRVVFATGAVETNAAELVTALGADLRPTGVPWAPSAESTGDEIAPPEAASTASQAWDVARIESQVA